VFYYCSPLVLLYSSRVFVFLCSVPSPGAIFVFAGCRPYGYTEQTENIKPYPTTQKRVFFFPFVQLLWVYGVLCWCCPF